MQETELKGVGVGDALPRRRSHTPGEQALGAFSPCPTCHWTHTCHTEANVPDASTNADTKAHDFFRTCVQSNVPVNLCGVKNFTSSSKLKQQKGNAMSADGTDEWTG